MLAGLGGALLVGLSLGLLGSGGSILTVPALTLLVGQDEKIAIAGSLGVVGVISLVAGLPYLRGGRVDGRSLVLFGLPGMVGAGLGAELSRFVSGETQLLTFAGLMLVAAVFMLRPPRVPVAACDTCREDGDARAAGASATPATPVTTTARRAHTPPATSGAPRRSAWLIGVEGLAVGALTGFVGVGGGFLIVPALVLLGGLSLQRAIGTSLFIIAAKSFVGFWRYEDVLAGLELQLDYGVLAAFAAVGIAASLVGGALGPRLPQGPLRKGFAVMLVLVGALVLLRG